MNVFIENKQTKQVYECNTLGVKIDQHLSWKGNMRSVKKYQQESLLLIKSNRLLIKKHLFWYITLLFIRTSTTAVKYGMYLVQLNQNDGKIEQL